MNITNINEAPTVTSGATASFAENGTGTVYTVTANDPDAATTLSYSLTGSDAALFNINSSTGAVTFITAPNFEAPYVSSPIVSPFDLRDYQEIIDPIA